MADRRFLVATTDPAGRPPGPLPPGVRLRAIQPGDDEPLASLLFDAYVGTIDFGADDSIETARSAIASWRAGEDGEPAAEWSVVATGESGELLAACIVSRWRGRPLVHFQMTAAAEKGRGLARATLTAAMDGLWASDQPEITLVVTHGNDPAERLYASLGFRDAPVPS